MLNGLKVRVLYPGKGGSQKKPDKAEVEDQRNLKIKNATSTEHSLPADKASLLDFKAD
jgi:hypothetical protein